MAAPLFAVAGSAGAYFFLHEGVDFAKCLDSGSLANFTPTNSCNKVTFNPTASLMVVAHTFLPYVTVIDTTTWEKVALPSTTFMGAALCCAFSPDGSKLAIGHTNNPRVTVYDTATWTAFTIYGGTPSSAVQALSFSGDGTKLAISYLTAPFFTVYNVVSDFDLITTPSTDVVGTSRACAFSQNGAFLAVGSSSTPFLTVYNTSDWSKITLGTAAGSAVYSVAFSPDNSRLVVGLQSVPRLMIYNTTSWSTVFVPLPPSGTVNDIAFYDGGSKVAIAISGAVDSIRLYDASTGALITPTNPMTFGNTSNGCAFSPVAISRSVQGVVRDDTDTPGQRVVRLYNRGTGALLVTNTSAENGAFGPFPFASPIEVQRVVLDDASGTVHNDIIDRVIPE